MIFLFIGIVILVALIVRFAPRGTLKNSMSIFDMLTTGTGFFFVIFAILIVILLSLFFEMSLLLLIIILIILGVLGYAIIR